MVFNKACILVHLVLAFDDRRLLIGGYCFLSFIMWIVQYMTLSRILESKEDDEITKEEED